jgi:hypothetical protein
MMLSVVSLPFLCAWGLPVSLLSIIGNLIFGPFLALFLLLSSCLFFAHLVGYSASYIGVLLNWLCWLWLKLMSVGSPLFLVAVPESMLFFSAVCALIACITLHHKLWGRVTTHTAILCWLTVILVIGCKWQEKSYLTHALYNKRKMILVSKEDRGGLTEKRSPASFVQFSLIPTLCKVAGTLTVDAVVLHKISKKTVVALEQLQKTVKIKKIVYAPQKASKTDYTELLTRLHTIAPVTVEPVTPRKKKKRPVKTPSLDSVLSTAD